MKNEKGITLVSLVVTIVLMLVIASTVTISGLDSVKTAQRTTFITELEMIQEKVNVIYEKRKTNSSDIAYYDSLGQDISVLSQAKLDEILQGASQEGYRYFSKQNLKQLDLDNISQDVIINYNTKDIVSVKGFEIDGTRYYRLTDIPTYNGYNVEYVNKNDKAPTFDVEIQELSNSWRFNIKNITYTSNVSGGSVSYKLHDSQNWILVGENKYFEVYSPGIYDVKLTDRAGNSTTKENTLVGTEIFREEFEDFTYDYDEDRIQINACSNSILDMTSKKNDPRIYMYNVTSFNPSEHRFIEIKYKTTDSNLLELYMIENPEDETYVLKNKTLNKDGEWHTCIFDLWSNEAIKNRDNITGWRFDWGDNQQSGVSIQIDYIRVV